MEQCYFLDARDLATIAMQEDVRERAFAKLDRERARRLSRMLEMQEQFARESRQQKPFLQGNVRQITAWTESLGAGLLLQYALQDYLAGADGGEIQVVTPSQILEDAREVVPLSLRYGEKGKPYLEKLPLFFSLSHSQGRVICAVSETEVGADLQYPRNLDAAGLAARFFSEEEKRAFEGAPKREQEDFFYRLWVRKEAYGKFTGEGVGKVLTRNLYTADGTDTVQEGSCILEWREFVHDGAYIAVCYERK